MTPDAGIGDNIDATAPYNIDPTSSTLYDWINNSANVSGDIVAQLGLYHLAGSASPDFEVSFNYTTFTTTGNAYCTEPSTAPSFTRGGTYTFTAPLSDLCEAAYTNDFLFTGTTLYGWVDDDGDVVTTPDCPLGWTCPAAAPTPEPDTLALMMGGALLAFFGLHQRALLRRASDWLRGSLPFNRR